jgi:hypothetical protein
MLSVRSFQFRTGLRDLFAPTMRVVTIHVQGAELHIPPKQDRGPLMPDDPKRRGQPREGILVDKLIFDDLKLVIETRTPGKVPLEFDVANLTLKNVGLKQPFLYDATVRNPKPVGEVRSTGHFGPWQNDNPRDTPIDGSYIFSHADLSTIKGIGGILNSNGQFSGTLDRIAVDGTSDTPDFHLTIGGHSMPLHTSFHAIVDGTSGDTYLQPVQALLAHSPITATGSVTRKPGVHGHDVELQIAVHGGRIEDFLALGVRTSPAILRGAVDSKATISIPQGEGMTVTRRMKLNGSFSVTQATFANAKLQQQIDDLSERARGWPEKAKPGEAPTVTSSLNGGFVLANEQMNVSRATFQIPGATVTVDGNYGMDGKTLDFHGLVRTEATASEMVGGWKGLLVMPFDPLLKKHGAGVELPFMLGGTPSDPKLSIDFGHKIPAIPVKR